MGAILAPAGAGSAGGAVRGRDLDPASAAFAVRFSRVYLAAAGVAQAEVAAAQELGAGREVLTVACELRDSRTLYLAVPVSRSGAGGVAALGAPWIVAAPSGAGVAIERPRPLAGPEASAIRTLAGKFVPAYLSARSPRELSYLLAPAAAVIPLAGSLEMLGSPSAVTQLGEGEGRRRTVVVSGRFRDPVAGTVYRLAYRLELVRRARWYVRSVQEAPS